MNALAHPLRLSWSTKTISNRFFLLLLYWIEKVSFLFPIQSSYSTFFMKIHWAFYMISWIFTFFQSLSFLLPHYIFFCSGRHDLSYSQCYLILCPMEKIQSNEKKHGKLFKSCKKKNWFLHLFHWPCKRNIWICLANTKHCIRCMSIQLKSCALYNGFNHKNNWIRYVEKLWLKMKMEFMSRINLTTNWVHFLTGLFRYSGWLDQCAHFFFGRAFLFYRI